MIKKEENSKEYAIQIAKTDKEFGCKPNSYQANMLVQAYESGYHAAMEYLYKLPLDTMVEEIIKEVKNK